MKIKYEIEEYEPDREYVLVKFTHPDNPDFQYYKSINPPDFSKAKFLNLVEAVASCAGGFWNRAVKHPAECPIPMEGEVDVEPENYMAEEIHPVFLDQPEYDVWSEYIVQQDLTSPFQETVGWEIMKLSDEEREIQYQHLEMSIRYERNELLAMTDYIHMPDCAIKNTDEFLAYRQALRDLPEADGWPKNIEWPEVPSPVK